MGRCWGGRGILEGGEEDWIVWEHTAGNGVAKGEGGRGDSQRESIFEAQGTERDAVGFGYTAFALWDEGNMIPTKD
jgi:hypothetical protein